MSLHTRLIPGTQESLPAIGLGSWQTFDVGSGSAMPRAVLDAFLQLGGRLIDSSPMYGGAEEIIGASLSALRPPQKPFIATKVWTSGRLAGVQQMAESQINSLAEREAERTLLPLAADRGIGVIVNRPFAEGSVLKRLNNRALPAAAR